MKAYFRNLGRLARNVADPLGAAAIGVLTLCVSILHAALLGARLLYIKARNLIVC